MFLIRLGVPEMERLWVDLKSKALTETLSKDEESLYKSGGRLWYTLHVIPNILAYIVTKFLRYLVVMVKRYGNHTLGTDIYLPRGCSGYTDPVKVISRSLAYNLIRKIQRVLDT